ncbi:RNA polymerase factor sigma-54 [Biformimicrobium ophioploci]|uniref:RNA polymerase sigma-54 factor n=1 Tax=Biformimicrobium ophioploci TaxID=3036711 RepID=A0ABQ6LX03_9GAMM|nr:RNA polymerase factor sigma-54 [Microbulbifer sp. NKW57]GMG86599.1 RNA polymerase factor sigma-54 [Microbulbifer sp. NKW57]
MKQSLQLKLGTHLTMTPQLQQAIRLLQLSTLDLQQEIQQALDSNPMLESEADSGIAEQEEPSPRELSTQEPASPDQNSDSRKDVEDQSTADDWNQDIPNELPVDTQWDDVYSSSPSSSAPSAPADDSLGFEHFNSAPESLQQHLAWQLNLTALSDADKAIGTAIIDAIAPSGLLCMPLAEIIEGMDDVEEDEAHAVLTTIQQFDPAGVGACDLAECLMLQLRQLPAGTPWLQEARTIIGRHMALLGNRDFRTLMRRMRLKEPELGEVLKLIQTLNPRPGDAIEQEEAQYVVPDVIVSRHEDRWVVELNPETTPRLRINNEYASLIRRADNSSDNNYLRDNLQEARWFLKSLQSRNETLLKVASSIIEKQREFFEHGPESMKPMVLADVAEAIGMHESTISRVTTQKYMMTPQGIFELKYFFSSHVGTDTGEDASSTAIRAMIRKLIEAETPRKPLSDNKITQMLDGKGIKVARRTVAKYRESMNIPSSSERKRLV